MKDEDTNTEVTFKVLQFDLERLKLIDKEECHGEVFVYAENSQAQLQLTGYLYPGTVKRGKPKSTRNKH